MDPEPPRGGRGGRRAERKRGGRRTRAARARRDRKGHVLIRHTFAGPPRQMKSSNRQSVVSIPPVCVVVAHDSASCHHCTRRARSVLPSGPDDGGRSDFFRGTARERLRASCAGRRGREPPRASSRGRRRFVLVTRSLRRSARAFGPRAGVRGDGGDGRERVRRRLGRLRGRAGEVRGSDTGQGARLLRSLLGTTPSRLASASEVVVASLDSSPRRRPPLLRRFPEPPFFAPHPLPPSPLPFASRSAWRFPCKAASV